MLLAWGVLAVFPCAAVAQIAILNLRVVEGDGAVHQAGSRTARPLTVEVIDETGRPQAGVAISFHLPEEGPSGILSNGLRTDLVLSDANGRAVLRGLQVNRVPGPFRIRITAVKEQTRAGIVSLQYIAGTESHASAGGPASAAKPAVAKPAATKPVPAQARSRISRKWIVIAAIAAGAAAGGIRAGSGGAKSAPGAAAATTASSVSIGVPTISLGKP